MVLKNFIEEMIKYGEGVLYQNPNNDFRGLSSISWMPIHYAASSGQWKVILLLQKYGADYDGLAKDLYHKMSSHDFTNTSLVLKKLEKIEKNDESVDYIDYFEDIINESSFDKIIDILKEETETCRRK